MMCKLAKRFLCRNKYGYCVSDDYKGAVEGLYVVVHIDLSPFL